MRGVTGGARMKSLATFSDGPLHTDAQVWEDRLELIYCSSVRMQDVAWKTCRRRWMIEIDGERRSGKSVEGPRNDDDVKKEIREICNEALIL